MPYNGSGTYVRTENWTSDAANNLPINAPKFDTEANDMGSALSLCITRDNQGKPSAPLTWAQPLTLTPPAATVALTLNGVSGQDVLDINPTQSGGVGFGINLQAAGGGFNGDFRAIQVVNPSTGTANTIYGLMIGTNGSNQFLLGKTGASFSGTKFANGPTGEVAWIWAGNTLPLVIAYGSGGAPNAALVLNSSTGALTLNAPTASATALTVNGIANNNALNVVAATSPAGQSFGQNIFGGTNSSDWALVCNNAAQTQQFFKVQGDGAVKFAAIGTTASAANAFLDNAASNNLLRSTSSIRYKTDVHSVRGAMDIALALRPITYRSLAKADDPERLHYGLVAEDVASVDSSLVNYDEEGRPDGVQYDRVAVILLAAFQQLAGRI
jgi:hypothetical protein